jgi:hypothetical protein
MISHKDEEQEWRSFLHTIDLLTAAALADLDAEAELKPASWTRKFEITLLAAAGADGVRLPSSEVLSEGNELGVVITPEHGQIFLKLQLQGFAALEQFGGREARLVSDNGAIDYRLHFNSSGSAACVLSDASSVREGLSKFAIFFAEGDTPAASHDFR